MIIKKKSKTNLVAIFIVFFSLFNCSIVIADDAIASNYEMSGQDVPEVKKVCFFRRKMGSLNRGWCKLKRKTGAFCRNVYYKMFSHKPDIDCVVDGDVYNVFEIIAVDDDAEYVTDFEMKQAIKLASKIVNEGFLSEKRHLDPSGFKLFLKESFIKIRDAIHTMKMHNLKSSSNTQCSKNLLLNARDILDVMISTENAISGFYGKGLCILFKS